MSRESRIWVVLSATVGLASMLTGLTGLAMVHGFDAPVGSIVTRHAVLLSAVIALGVSRLLGIVPPRRMRRRQRRWPEWLLLAAGVAWWMIDRSEWTLSIVLECAAGYCIVTGVIAGVRTGLRQLTEDRGRGGTLRWCVLIVAGVALVGGAVLALPVCWSGSHPLTWDETYDGQIRFEMIAHGTNCLFTAAAAITGTGLSVHDLGRDFTRTGQTVILVLMQAGGLGICVLGSVLGWRLRLMAGWHAREDTASPMALKRLILFVVVVLGFIEGIGIASLAVSSLADAQPTWPGRLFEATFLAVSATCNVGLTMTDNSLIGQRGLPETWSIILPLMLLGSIGGPVAYDLYRRFRRRIGRLGRDTRITLLATAVLVIGGAGLLYGIESTSNWQERYSRHDVPERLRPGGGDATTGAIVFSAEDSDRVRSQRLRTLLPADRWSAALFQSVASRTGGLQTVRLDVGEDNPSLSPASRLVLMAWMLIGGAMGGTAGGVRITVVVLLVSAILSRKAHAGDLRASRRRVLLPAGAAAAAMLVLIGVTTMVLTYRQPVSMEACLSEAVSATCNVGFTTGLTSSLPREDRLDGPMTLRLASRVMLIVAMLLGRVLPVGLLLRHARPSSSERLLPYRPMPATDP